MSTLVSEHRNSLLNSRPHVNFAISSASYEKFALSTLQIQIHHRRQLSHQNYKQSTLVVMANVRALSLHTCLGQTLMRAIGPDRTHRWSWVQEPKARRLHGADSGRGPVLSKPLLQCCGLPDSPQPRPCSTAAIPPKHGDFHHGPS